MKFLSRPVVYVRISAAQLSVRYVQRGLTLSEPGTMAINRSDTKVLAVGREAEALRAKPEVLIARPFVHPRTPLSDFTVAEKLLLAFLLKLSLPPWPAPRLVMHVLPTPQGGLTQIEIRALLELGANAGRGRCIAWSGPELDDRQLLAGQFPDAGEVLGRA